MCAQLARLREELDRVIERLDAGLGHTGSGPIAIPMELGELGPKPSPTSKASCNALRPDPLLVGQTK